MKKKSEKQPDYLHDFNIETGKYVGQMATSALLLLPYYLEKDSLLSFFYRDKDMVKTDMSKSGLTYTPVEVNKRIVIPAGNVFQIPKDIPYEIGPYLINRILILLESEILRIEETALLKAIYENSHSEESFFCSEEDTLMIELFKVCSSALNDNGVKAQMFIRGPLFEKSRESHMKALLEGQEWFEPDHSDIKINNKAGIFRQNVLDLDSHSLTTSTVEVFTDYYRVPVVENAEIFDNNKCIYTIYRHFFGGSLVRDISYEYDRKQGFILDYKATFFVAQASKMLGRRTEVGIEDGEF